MDLRQLKYFVQIAEAAMSATEMLLSVSIARSLSMVALGEVSCR
jgi:hypothetical protein